MAKWNTARVVEQTLTDGSKVYDIELHDGHPPSDDLKEQEYMDTDKLIGHMDPNVPFHRIQQHERGYLDNLKKQITDAGGVKNALWLKRKPDGSPLVWEGHHRIVAAKELGIKQLPVTWKE